MLGEYPPVGEIHDRPIFLKHVEDVVLSPDYLAEETLCPLFDN